MPSRLAREHERRGAVRGRDGAGPSPLLSLLVVDLVVLVSVVVVQELPSLALGLLPDGAAAPFRSRAAAAPQGRGGRPLVLGHLLLDLGRQRAQQLRRHPSIALVLAPVRRREDAPSAGVVEDVVAGDEPAAVRGGLGQQQQGGGGQRGRFGHGGAARGRAVGRGASRCSAAAAAAALDRPRLLERRLPEDDGGQSRRGQTFRAPLPGDAGRVRGEPGPLGEPQGRVGRGGESGQLGRSLLPMLGGAPPAEEQARLRDQCCGLQLFFFFFRGTGGRGFLLLCFQVCGIVLLDDFCGARSREAESM